jgi:hypothetical protein
MRLLVSVADVFDLCVRQQLPDIELRAGSFVSLFECPELAGVEVFGASLEKALRYREDPKQSSDFLV